MTQLRKLVDILTKLIQFSTWLSVLIHLIRGWTLQLYRWFVSILAWAVKPIFLSSVDYLLLSTYTVILLNKNQQASIWYQICHKIVTCFSHSSSWNQQASIWYRICHKLIVTCFFHSSNCFFFFNLSNYYF